MRRVFFDRSRPFLPQVAERLVADASGGSLDLGSVVLVLPGRRATRTLEAYLQVAVEREIKAGRVAPDWIPPAYTTVGAAPETLYVPRKRPATRTTRLICRARAFRAFAELAPDRAKTLVSSGTAPTSLAAELELAQIFLALADELASERRDCAAVAATCRRRGELDEAARWASIGELESLYRKELARIGETDVDVEREAALARGEIGTTFDSRGKRFVVVGAVDLNRIQKAIFGALGDRVEFFVFAPESESDRFDEFGCVDPDAWETAEIPIPDGALIQVDSPPDQGRAVALLVRELSKRFESPDGGAWTYSPIEPESLTVGVPSDEVVPFVEKELGELGYATIRAQGTPASKNRVFQLLRDVADYLETRSFSALEDLVRRPDVEAFLIRVWNTVALPKSGSDETDDESSSEIGAGSIFDADADGELELAAEIDSADEPDASDAEPELAEIDADADEPSDASESASDAPKPFVPGDWLSEFDRYRATFLPTRVDGRWFEYKNDDAPRQNAEFRLLRKVALLIEKALAPFCDPDVPPIRREDEGAPSASDAPKRTGFDPFAGNLASLKTSPAELTAARAAVFSGEFEFAKDDFSERFRLRTNRRELPLRDWAPIIADFLRRIYPDPEPNAGRESDADVQIDSFFAILGRALDELDEAPRDLSEAVSSSDAIRTLLKGLAQTPIPPRPADRVVELQGWLDLPFDDAPNLILTGFNEGVVPTSRASDLFLPNETRRELGLEDAKRRFARDAYLTTVLATSKRNFFAVFGKRSLQNDPSTPSRFAFATVPDAVPGRMLRFFGGKGPNDLETLVDRQEGRPFPRASIRPTSLDVSFGVATGSAPDVAALGDVLPFPLPAPATDSPNNPPTVPPATERGFRAPILRTTGPAPTKMRVTEFRDFLACPYRYFLRDALKLRAAALESTVEMNAAAFGTLAHAALRDFGADPAIKDSTDPGEIADWLSARLDSISGRYFNELSSPFVRIQLEQIRGRLRAFARWQASWRRSGARIEYVEASPASGAITFDVGANERPVEIFGRLDRIDYNPATNRWFVFDYKTFDSAREGRKASAKDVESGDAPDFGEEIVDPETQTTLFSTRVGNVADEKHRKRTKPHKTAALATLAKYGVEPASNARAAELRGAAASNAAPDAPAASFFDWIDLQLPLYRRFFRQILFERYDGKRARADVDATKVELGYVVLTKSDKTQAFGGPWTERDLLDADATASRVIRTIRRLWRAPIDPNALLDPNDPTRGTIMSAKAPAFSEEFSPITLDYLRD